MASRTPFRIMQSPLILMRAHRLFVKRAKPSLPQKILIIHHLLLGDTLMVTSLLAKLREKFPNAEIYMAMPESFVPLYEGRPYGVKAVPFNPFKHSSFFDLLQLPQIDWAFVPGDNRYGWTAFALGAKWIIGFDGDRPAYKSWCFDELIQYPDSPQAWTDITAHLVDGKEPKPFQTIDWTEPSHEAFTLPDKPYALFHIGARSSLKSWPADKWDNLINEMPDKTLKRALTCGPGETDILKKINLQDSFFLYPGNLSLAQMWKLTKEARLLVCPDNGIAHMGRIIGTPTVCLFGPASDLLYGAGKFWSNSPFQAVSKPMSCRDQHNVFKRHIEWAKTCERFPTECNSVLKCMEKIEVKDVLNAIERVMQK